MKKWWYAVGIVINIILVMASPRFGRTLIGRNPIIADGIEGAYLIELPYRYEGKVDDKQYKYVLKYAYDENFYVTIAYHSLTSRDFNITYSNGESVFETVYMDRSFYGDAGLDKKWYLGLGYNITVQDCYGTFYFIFIKSILIVSSGIWILLRIRPSHARCDEIMMKVIGIGLIISSLVFSLRLI